MGYYFLVGLLYTLINVLIRKIDADGDPLLVFVWVFVWPFCLVLLLSAFLQDKLKKKEI